MQLGTLSLEIKNNTAETVVIPSECPEAPLQIFMFKSAGYEEIKSDLEIDCSKVQDITSGGQNKHFI